MMSHSMSGEYKQMKYIIIEDHTLIMFDSVITRIQMAESFASLGEPTSAGFIEFDPTIYTECLSNDDYPHVFGHSSHRSRP